MCAHYDGSNVGCTCIANSLPEQTYSAFEAPRDHNRQSYDIPVIPAKYSFSDRPSALHDASQGMPERCVTVTP